MHHNIVSSCHNVVMLELLRPSAHIVVGVLHNDVHCGNDVITPQRCDLSHLCEVSHDIVVDHNVVVCRHNVVYILCYRTHYHNVVLIHHNVAIKS